ncbi:unnamed protein product [Symbiodinium natans]|uniref:Uncharacterized protein n=1 Tax=Symbiodinium natans TaxID=878477 RepID=A0A812NHR2_9DINO|nr:unnamed protein product [Symbiodinium natans]
MGCGGSCQNSQPRTVASFYMTAPQVVPEGAPLPPDRETHDAYIRKLNSCLKRVRKYPKVFQEAVELRRAECFDAVVAEEPRDPVKLPMRNNFAGRTRTF